MRKLQFFVKLIQYLTWEKIFFKNHAENETRRLVSGLILFIYLFIYLFILNKALKNQVVCTLVSIYFKSPQLGHAIKKLYKSLHCWFINILNIEKRSGTWFFTRLWEKCLPCYILLTNQILLSDCPYFLKYLKICVL